VTGEQTVMNIVKNVDTRRLVRWFTGVFFGC
jgi:hypothetical protein